MIRWYKMVVIILKSMHHLDFTGFLTVMKHDKIVKIVVIIQDASSYTKIIKIIQTSWTANYPAVGLRVPNVVWNQHILDGWCWRHLHEVTCLRGTNMQRRIARTFSRSAITCSPNSQPCVWTVDPVLRSKMSKGTSWPVDMFGPLYP